VNFPAFGNFTVIGLNGWNGFAVLSGMWLMIRLAPV
jgi:hypothetical protein